jgi:hypothetical protein
MGFCQVCLGFVLSGLRQVLEGRRVQMERMAPPSTGIIAPVTYDAAGESEKGSPGELTHSRYGDIHLWTGQPDP